MKPRRGAVQTITLDTDSEFAVHETVAKAVTAATYFCDTYCSAQRGANENTNGLIRKFFPKGKNFRQVTDAELRKVVKKLNDRPRSGSAWGNTQEPWIPQVLCLLLEFRNECRMQNQKRPKIT
ncbi:IS30 family transposase [Halomonas fontilapidosi]|uniref:IS30 family transposase n=1 Tax=Halomonas fontilapidosi TaxID=616675 RepID=A0A7W5DMI7_9GAMM|nr:IS30 family transposase [Halomonas fontilapidosi]MBB3185650.1 IS30 family transposase [Halomonas fontilapidosi]